MKEQPILKTQRLILRPFNLDYSADVKSLTGERVIAENTFSIPHQYGIRVRRKGQVFLCLLLYILPLMVDKQKNGPVFTKKC